MFFTHTENDSINILDETVDTRCCCYRRRSRITRTIIHSQVTYQPPRVRTGVGGVGAWYAVRNVLRGLDQILVRSVLLLASVLWHVLRVPFLVGFVAQLSGVNTVDKVVDKAVSLYFGKDGEIWESFWPDDKAFKKDFSWQVKVVDIDEDPWCGEHPCGLLLSDAEDNEGPRKGWEQGIPVEFSH